MRKIGFSKGILLTTVFVREGLGIEGKAPGRANKPNVERRLRHDRRRG
jgi:hypothetical protein